MSDQSRNHLAEDPVHLRRRALGCRKSQKNLGCKWVASWINLRLLSKLVNSRMSWRTDWPFKGPRESVSPTRSGCTRKQYNRVQRLLAADPGLAGRVTYIRFRHRITVGLSLKPGWASAIYIAIRLGHGWLGFGLIPETWEPNMGHHYTDRLLKRNVGSAMVCIRCLTWCRLCNLTSSSSWLELPSTW